MNLKFFKSLLLVVVLFLSIPAAEAQVVKVDSLSNWKKSFKAGFNLNQASFSSNWKGGGVNSFGFNGLLNYKLNYKKDKNSWSNEIDLLYGMVNNEGQGYRKTLDRVYLDTKYGHALTDKWDLAFALNLQSQFAKGYRYEKDANGVEQEILISDALAPAFITATIGAEYHPVDFFKVRLSPIAPRVTILRNSSLYTAVDSVAPYGVKIPDNTRLEWFAFQMIAEFNKDIAENINLNWRYQLFANYETLEGKKLDHRLDLNLTAKVNKFINVSLGGILLYDYDQDTGVQLSQAFSLGFLYTFQNYKEKK
ncbi:MAG: DUF3078 domain-containing protein [Cyclobacteriaceae bacterium]